MDLSDTFLLYAVGFEGGLDRIAFLSSKHTQFGDEDVENSDLSLGLFQNQHGISTATSESTP